MLAASASLLNIPIVILDTGTLGPAKQILSPPDRHIDGSFTDPEKIRELASRVDVLTVEIEHVDVAALEAVSSIAPVHPSPSTIRLIQDKFVQKQHLTARGCPVSEFMPVESIPDAVGKLGLPLMLKSRTLAYDGRGNFLLRDLAQADEALAFLGGGSRKLYAEAFVPFKKEIAVMVVRSANGKDVVSYPVCETVHKDNICHLVFAPLRSADKGLEKRAQKIAEDAIKTFEGAGIFGVEMFLMEDGASSYLVESMCILTYTPPPGQIYINEIAPRPHNSGHYTIEACETSQYENHLRAILGLPLGSTALKVPSSVMLNIIGTSESMDDINSLISIALTVPGASVHMYGKSGCRKGRKMGHITLVADNDAELRSRLRRLLPDAYEQHLYAPEGRKGFSHPQPLVGVIMGSDSDLPVMRAAAQILESFEVPFELSIVSAHRTPDRLVEYARSANSRGLKVVIAGAGGAAHLPGMVAAMTPLPVIGVPVKGSTLDGVDSLHSIVQMPVCSNILHVYLLSHLVHPARYPGRHRRDQQLNECGSVSCAHVVHCDTQSCS